MDGNDVVRDDPRPVRRRIRRAKSKAFKGAAHVFTAVIGGYPIPFFAHKKEIDGDAVGYWDPNTHEIGLQLPGQSPAAEADRVLHELIHAISVIMLPDGAQLTEAQVNTVSTGLIDTLTRNQALRDYMISRLTTEPQDGAGDRKPKKSAHSKNRGDGPLDKAATQDNPPELLGDLK